MGALLVIAGLALLPVGTDEPVLDARVVDVDADGTEDVVAVGRNSLLLLRGGRGPVVRRPVAPLTVVGRGLLGVVRDGRYRPVADPFGEWREGAPQARPLPMAYGAGEPALLRSPGDLDGDGRDDAILPTADGFVTPAGLVPQRPRAHLGIGRGEAFAIEWRIPVPAVGRWTGSAPELVFFDDRTLSVWRGVERVARVETRLGLDGAGVEQVARQHVLARDVHGNGRLDLVVVSAKGSAGLFGSFDAVVYLFADGRFHDADRGRFHRPASILKIEGALLAPRLFDADSDGDLDLALSIVDTSLLANATGTAPGRLQIFRLGEDGWDRRPAWTHEGRIPLASFRANPEPPVVPLPDLDGDGRPEALDVGGARPVLLSARRDGADAFAPVAEGGAAATGRPAVGATLAAVPVDGGLLVIGGAR